MEIVQIVQQDTSVLMDIVFLDAKIRTIVLQDILVLMVHVFKHVQPIKIARKDMFVLMVRCVRDPDDDGPDDIIIIPDDIGISTIPVGIVTDIVIQNPGIGYTDGDYIQIGDDCYYEPILTANGSIIGIKDISPCNIQFTTTPEIQIITDTGSGANAFPVAEYQTTISSLITKMLVSEVSRTIIDCVGIRDLVFVGWVNGFPYFGPYHEHEGKRMVGPVHTDRPHPTIYDTKEQSLFALNVTPTQTITW